MALPNDLSATAPTAARIGAAAPYASARRPLAVIDIGSNSARLVVVRVDSGGHLQILAGMRVPLGLARETAPGMPLSASAIARTLGAIEDFSAIASGVGAGHTVAVATAAVRDSSNADDLVDAVDEATGIRITVIDGETEAAYAFLGAVHGLPVEDGLMVDVGGGSTEVTQFADRKLVRSWTLPLGSLRVSEAFLASDPPAAREIRALQDHVAGILAAARLPRLRRSGSLIGTGGTVRNLARLTQRREDATIGRVHGAVITARALRKTAGALAERSTAERASISGVKPDRAGSITGGALLVGAMMGAVGARALTVSGQGLREGLAYTEVGIATLPPDAVRRASVLALTARFSTWDAPAAERRLAVVRGLSVALDGYATPELVEMLEHASTLLDIGRSIDYWDRFIHTAGIIAEADLTGFSHRGIAVLSALVRRAGDGSFAYKAFGGLLGDRDRPYIERAAIVLALSDDLERRTPRTQEPAVRCWSREDTVRVAADVAGGWWSEAIAQRFRRAFDRELVLTRIR